MRTVAIFTTPRLGGSDRSVIGSRGRQSADLLSRRMGRPRRRIRKLLPAFAEELDLDRHRRGLAHNFLLILWRWATYIKEFESPWFPSWFERWYVLFTLSAGLIRTL